MLLVIKSLPGLTAVSGTVYAVAVRRIITLYVVVTHDVHSLSAALLFGSAQSKCLDIGGFQHIEGLAATPKAVRQRRKCPSADADGHFIACFRSRQTIRMPDGKKLKIPLEKRDGMCKNRIVESCAVHGFLRRDRLDKANLRDCILVRCF